jgi:hypothetical protein
VTIKTSPALRNSNTVWSSVRPDVVVPLRLAARISKIGRFYDHANKEATSPSWKLALACTSRIGPAAVTYP